MNFPVFVVLSLHHLKIWSSLPPPLLPPPPLPPPPPSFSPAASFTSSSFSPASSFSPLHLLLLPLPFPAPNAFLRAGQPRAQSTSHFVQAASLRRLVRSRGGFERLHSRRIRRLSSPVVASARAANLITDLNTVIDVDTKFSEARCSKVVSFSLLEKLTLSIIRILSF